MKYEQNFFLLFVNMLKLSTLIYTNNKLGNIVCIFSYSVAILGLYDFGSITLASKMTNELKYVRLLAINVIL